MPLKLGCTSESFWSDGHLGKQSIRAPGGTDLYIAHASTCRTHARGSSIDAEKPACVQLSAAPNGAVQSKVRAYAHPGRSSGINRRDVEVEQSWCEDLARINKLLAERGILADIAHQEGPGTTEQILIPARRERSLDIGPAREVERNA